MSKQPKWAKAAEQKRIERERAQAIAKARDAVVEAAMAWERAKWSDEETRRLSLCCLELSKLMEETK